MNVSMLRTAALLLVGALLVSPAFATGTAETGAEKELIYNVNSETNGYDPGSSVGLDQQMVIQQAFEGLVRYDENGAVVPGQAESWDVLDGGQRYVFHLRDDIFWSDGEPVTAGDFVYT